MSNGGNDPLDPFAGIAADPAAWAEALARPEAPHRFAIHFTPRSGSTRLTAILARTGRLGHANEIFNPRFMATIARSWKVADLETYIALALRRQAVRGVAAPAAAPGPVRATTSWLAWPGWATHRRRSTSRPRRCRPSSKPSRRSRRSNAPPSCRPRIRNRSWWSERAILGPSSRRRRHPHRWW